MEPYRIIFLVISLVPLALGIFLYFKYVDLKKRAVFTKGKVVDIIERKIDSFGEKTVYYFPVISFTDMKGEKYEVSSETGEGSSKRIVVNDTVDIVYDRENPINILTKNNYNLLFPIIMFGMFVVFILIGLVGSFDSVPAPR